MDFAQALSLVTVVVGLGVAVLSLRVSSAPGWERYRSLTLVGITAALYAMLASFWELDVSAMARGVVLQLLGAVAGLHAIAWQSYVRRHLGPMPRYDRVLMSVSAVLGVLWLVPHLLYEDVVVVQTVPWLHVTYRFPALRTSGSLAFTVQISLFLVPLVRYARALRAGMPGARLHALALTMIFIAAVNDTLSASGVLRSPLLVAFGFMTAVGVLGWDVTRTFVASAQQLERLSRELEVLVEERTNALVSAEATLLRTEKMAALGQLSAGVAHEINNPAAAVSANLGYLRDRLVAGTAVPDDAAQCVDDCVEGMQRIEAIVAQLLDSGRAAAHARTAAHSASAACAVRKALATSKVRIGSHVAIAVDVPPGLLVRADEASLVQVLVNLVVNAAQAMPPTRQGRLAIRASTRGGTAAIEISDNGCGMSDDTKRRLFEPFYTTKPRGIGTGLGLSVSLGLLRSMGGDLTVTSSAAGTTMAVLLDRADLGRAAARRTAA